MSSCSMHFSMCPASLVLYHDPNSCPLFDSLAY
jgi:hypothetical protein